MRLLGLTPNPVQTFENIKMMAMARFRHVYQGKCPDCGAMTVSLRPGARTCECGAMFTMHLVQQRRLVA